MNEKSKWQEREDAIVRSIMSGNNACGTLKTALEKGRLEGFLRMMIQSTLVVCAGEEQQMEKDLAATRLENRDLRFAVEAVIANQHEAPVKNEVVMTSLRAAAPGHAFL